MKQDLNSTNTNTHNHCRWKSGYPSHLTVPKTLTPLSVFRKKDSQKRTPRKTGPLPPHSAPVIRFLHRPHPAILRRPLPIVGIPTNQNKMRKLPCTRFSQASNLAEENQLQTAGAATPPNLPIGPHLAPYLEQQKSHTLNPKCPSPAPRRAKKNFPWLSFPKGICV